MTTTTKYLLSIYQPAGDPPPPDALAAIMEDVEAVRSDMIEREVWVFSGGLHAPDTASVVREGLVTDGPFAEAKEYLGGFTIIEEADLDAALGWARRLHAATGLPIEVRPFAG